MLPNQPVNIQQKPPQLAPSQNNPNWQQSGPSGYGGQQNFNNNQQPAITVQSQGPVANVTPNMNQFHNSPNLNRHATPLSQNMPAQLMQALMNNRQNQVHSSPQPGPSQQQMTPQMQNVPQVPTQQSLAPPPPAHVQQINRAMSPMPQVPQGVHIPPLELNKFKSGLSNYLMKKGLNLDHRALSVDNRQIDLHALHTETMKLGGPGRVSAVVFVCPFRIELEKIF